MKNPNHIVCTVCASHKKGNRCSCECHVEIFHITSFPTQTHLPPSHHDSASQLATTSFSAITNQGSNHSHTRAGLLIPKDAGHKQPSFSDLQQQSSPHKTTGGTGAASSSLFLYASHSIHTPAQDSSLLLELKDDFGINTNPLQKSESLLRRE